MNSLRMGASYLAEARLRLRTAEVALDEKEWPYAYRQSQECVELALKALLRFAAVEPPKWHDVSTVLDSVADDLPEAARARLDELKRISTTLRERREQAMYGVEEEELTPHDVIVAADAAEAVEWARTVVALVDDALERET